MNQYYVGELLRDFPKLKAVVLVSYAAGESALNVLVERPWSQHKKTVVGQRLGSAFLNGERRAPTKEEMPEFFKSVGRELKEIWEATVNIAEKGNIVEAPLCEYVGAMTEAEVQEAVRVRNFFMNNTRKAVSNPADADLLRKAKSDNKRTFQTFNCSWVFSKECDREELFGPTKRPLMPERIEIDGHKHYSTLLQKKDKYKNAPQNDYVMPAIQGREKIFRCCDRLWRFAAGLKRHVVLCHDRDGRNQKSKRKRPEPVGHRTRVVRCRVQESPEPQGAPSSGDEEMEASGEGTASDGEESDGSLQAEQAQNLDFEADSSSDEALEDELGDADVKEEHNGIIGTVAVSRQNQDPHDFFVRYPKDSIEGWTSINSECLLLSVDDFEDCLVDPPTVTRESLSLDGRALDR